MNKQMICSRGTEEHIEATWFAWPWPGDQYLHEHHKGWLNTNCAQYWHHINRTLYFQHEADLQAWSVAHSQEPALTHRVMIHHNNRDLIDESSRWCEQQWGPDLFRGNWPQGTWTYGFANKMGTCMQFAQEEHAAQFALTFT